MIEIKDNFIVMAVVYVGNVTDDQQHMNRHTVTYYTVYTHTVHVLYLHTLCMSYILWPCSLPCSCLSLIPHSWPSFLPAYLPARLPASPWHTCLLLPAVPASPCLPPWPTHPHWLSCFLPWPPCLFPQPPCLLPWPTCLLPRLTCLLPRPTCLLLLPVLPASFPDLPPCINIRTCLRTCPSNDFSIYSKLPAYNCWQDGWHVYDFCSVMPAIFVND